MLSKIASHNLLRHKQVALHFAEDGISHELEGDSRGSTTSGKSHKQKVAVL